MKVILTGAAGFIGYHVARRLLATTGVEVLGIDSVNDYYSVPLKRARLARLTPHPNFRFAELDFAQADAYAHQHLTFAPDYVIHLGAQAGVRHSITHPEDYVHSNLIGFSNVLAACRIHPPKHLLYASSSSVYGADSPLPYAEDAAADRPVSFYAATKRSNELMAYSHAHLHGLPVTGLRFFTVYGPWGRPDMTPMIFARAILRGLPVKLFNEGRNQRDFTYIDDIVDGILALLHRPTQSGSARIFNLGNNHPIEMRTFVRTLEQHLGCTAQLELLPAQAGDPPITCASLAHVQAAIGYNPKVDLAEGLKHFVNWFRDYGNLGEP
jgi:UDP-glucuronate 4-epimerase